MLWALDAMIGRIAKRLMIYMQDGRSGVLQQQKLMQFFLSEEILVTLSSSPALNLLLFVERLKSEVLSAFLRKYYDRRNLQWNGILAKQEYESISQFEEQLESATPDYKEVLKSLGGKWHEIPSLDSINNPFDELGHGVCMVLAEFPALLSNLPLNLKPQIEFLASLRHAGPAKCCVLMGIEVPMLDERAQLAALAKIFEI